MNEDDMLGIMKPYAKESHVCTLLLEIILVSSSLVSVCDCTAVSLNS